MLSKRYLVPFVTLMAVVAAGPARAADERAAQEKEQKLIQVLQSDVPKSEKAIPCKQLAVYGTKAAVPALAPLLADPELASWARIALEAIPDAAADDALRQALGQLKGRLLIGAINSLAQRRSAGAVEDLVPRLKDADSEVAAAVAEALGRIGGTKAAAALEPFLTSGPPAVRSAVAIGCILCAEQSLAQGNRAAAVALYDAVRKADVPRQRLLEATRGTIIAQGPAGIPLLLNLLRSTDKARFGLGLSTARELPSLEVTAALETELAQTSPEHQALLLLVLADRGDATALSAVQKCLQSDQAKVRIAALAAVGALGDASQVELLLKSAKKGSEEAVAVRDALMHLRGDVDKSLIACARSGDAAVRVECLVVLSSRAVAEAKPLFLEALKDREESIRQAGFAALRKVAGSAQFPELLRQFQTAEAEGTRRGLQELLVSLCRRSEQRADCQRQLVAAWKNTSGPARLDVLEILCSLDIPASLGPVQEGLRATDVEALQKGAAGFGQLAEQQDRSATAGTGPFR